MTRSMEGGQCAPARLPYARLRRDKCVVASVDAAREARQTCTGPPADGRQRRRQPNQHWCAGLPPRTFKHEALARGRSEHGGVVPALGRLACTGRTFSPQRSTLCSCGAPDSVHTQLRCECVRARHAYSASRALSSMHMACHYQPSTRRKQGSSRARRKSPPKH